MSAIRLVAFAVVLALSAGCPPAASGASGGGTGASGGGAGAGGGGAAGGGQSGGGAGGAAGGSSGGGSAGGGAAGGGSADGGVEGVELMTALAGLWQGAATQTPLGSFPQMTVDFRPVGGTFLFGQTETDSANSLRFGFSIETYGGRDVLAYRNGGYFQGVLRDTRTALQSVDPVSRTYQFCAVPQGCGYLDARWRLDTADQLTFDVKVRGAQHLLWTAVRKQTRAVPSPFPSTLASQGDGSRPWPTLGTVRANVSWSAPLSKQATVWVQLSTTPCAPTFQCFPSRLFSSTVDAGVTQVSMTLRDVHAGSYSTFAVVDRNQDLATTHAAGSGDGIATDQPLTVPDAGEGLVTLPVTYEVP
ncbi:MAG: hypothetical protein K1X89_01610 [Myxococcaceae bacterium]|nr:hypothetical protein [Myxococcaceae bacterium]